MIIVLLTLLHWVHDTNCYQSKLNQSKTKLHCNLLQDKISVKIILHSSQVHIVIKNGFEGCRDLEIV